jgi:hypothetical protein
VTDGRSLTKEADVTITQRRRNPQRWWAGLAVVVALSLIGAACGDDDDEGAKTDDAAHAGSDSSEAATADDTTAFCDGRLALENAFNAEQPDADAIGALLDDWAGSAPDDLVANVTGLSAVLSQAAESGGDPTSDPAFGENIGPIDEFVLAECGFEKVEVSAVDYSFKGIPATVPAGTVAFAFTNDGTEKHEMVMFKRANGEDRSVEDLLALPEDQLGDSLIFAGAAQADPGQTSAAITDLASGKYIAVCFLPVGGAEDGPPHFVQGMTAEFEVT